jgi:hypothetical protein
VRLIRANEYKRRQAPVGIRVTHRGFGRDWRYPITNRFHEDELPAPARHESEAGKIATFAGRGQ